MWAKVVAFFKTVLPGFIKTQLVPLLLKALGITGGFWTWLAGFILLKFFNYEIKKAESVARMADQKKIDDANEVIYKKDIARGAPVEKLIEDELAILNGTKPK